MSNRHRLRIAKALANAFVCASEWTDRSLLAVGVIALGEKPRWLRAVVRASLRRFSDRPQTTHDLQRAIADLRVLGEGLLTSHNARSAVGVARADHEPDALARRASRDRRRTGPMARTRTDGAGLVRRPPWPRARRT